MYKILSALARAAIRAETHEDKNGNPSVHSVHRFYSPAMIDGELYRVKLTVQDYALTDGCGLRDLHALEAVEIETPGESLLQGTQGTLNAAPPAQTGG